MRIIRVDAYIAIGGVPCALVNVLRERALLRLLLWRGAHQACSVSWKLLH